jgi:ATP-dependent DNA helicase RecQ
MTDLAALLHTTFGFPAFRANQEAVCRAVTDGRDALLVMPTGAGKSLCYQLPAIARGGTALVISPLIALMDDQAGKLAAAGLRVGRIHSGLSRDHARQACRDYLDGTLNFLFIAPERMRVPGFPEMLARRKPSLVAIDEAHCISAWGHDFRPDYRTLGEHLPALRPAPILALTATATPTVQKDIAAQLQLNDPALFIHGFRRSNLAIEVVEMTKSRRHEFTAKLLKDATARPAIVYAPSRKAAEQLAGELGHHFPSAAYHAGLESSVRERVQAAFQSGKLDVVVATIAFGMGIDKADVRTVVHIALPGSVEAFYQEIGRAGRDGLPSRTVLLHDFVDRKTQEFLLDRNYPALTDVARVLAALTDEFQMPDVLRGSLGLDREVLDKAVEKLIAQGCATVDMAGNIRRIAGGSTSGWRSSYEAQRNFRRGQIDRMVAFAETQQCRMAALVSHFGDASDGRRPCGNCDFCAPHKAIAQQFAAPISEQAEQLRAILRALDSARAKATGKLHSELLLGPLSGVDRKAFDALLDALARAGLITLTSETFTNAEGRILPYKKASLTHEGRGDDATDLTGVLLPAALDGDRSHPTRNRSAPRSSRKSSETTRTKLQPSKRASTAATRQTSLPMARIEEPTAPTHSFAGSSPALRRARPAAADPTADLTLAQQLLDQRLRAWRKAESEKIGLPQFFVLGSSTLRSIVLARPRTLSQLQGIAGIGPDKAAKFGAGILELCNA